MYVLDHTTILQEKLSTNSLIGKYLEGKDGEKPYLFFQFPSTVIRNL